MGSFHETIPPHIYSWILLQHMFWISTAPLSASGHINVSPKGGQYFGLLDHRTFWYMDLTGSGNETIAHLRENGRVTVMFNAFEGAPRIVRLWGFGRILERESEDFNRFVAENDVQTIPATRSIIIVDVHQVGSSCGYSVPFMEFRDYRKTLNQVFEKKQKDYDSGKSQETMDRYWAYKNAWSMDGLPGMQRGLDCGANESVAPIVKMVGPWAPSSPYGPKSLKLRNLIQYHLTTLDKTRIQLKSVIMLVLLAFLIGLAVASYAVPSLSSSSSLLDHSLRDRLARILI